MNDSSTQSLQAYFPWREGNRFEILIDGSNSFPKMLKAIDSARQSVLIEMYLIESGAVVDRFIVAVQNAAQRGVKAYLLLDDFGAIKLRKHDRDRLVHKNIQVVYYNKLRSHSTLYNLYRIFLRHNEVGLYRDHRKLLLVDGETAFVGGIGLTDEFDSPDQPEKSWRETVVKILGPVVRDWQQLFLQNWEECTHQPVLLPPIEPTSLSDTHLGRITVNQSGQHSEILLSLTKQMYHAKHRIWIATAYFVPNWRIRRMLKRAARSKIDVRLLLPGPITDHPAVRYVSHRFYGRLLRNGVRIYEYQPRFFHAKCVLCDSWVSIGSSNFDRWNLRWNLEANQEMKDENLAKRVKEMFEEDFSNSVEYTYGVWQKRHWLLRLQQWFWRHVERLSQRIGR